jgi:hypothetical protein
LNINVNTNSADANPLSALEQIVSHNDPLQKYELKEVIGSGGAGKASYIIYFLRL